RKRMQENMGYDKIVKGVLTATSREGKSPEDWLEQVIKIDQSLQSGFDTDYAHRDTLDLFWRRQQMVAPALWGEKTAAAFMGVRLECAQCHKHPFDRWTQQDYRSYANVFAQLNYQASPEAKKLIDAENAKRKQAQPKAQLLSIVKEVWVMNAGKFQ